MMIKDIGIAKDVDMKIGLEAKFAIKVPVDFHVVQK